MKKYLSHILVFSLFSLVIFLSAGLPHVVHAGQPLPGVSTGAQQIQENAVGGVVKDWVIGVVVAPLSLLILKITSLLTILSGGILNFVVDYTIVKMAENYKNIGAISSAWGTVRDVANMGFIFILLYASIQMILGEGKDTRKLIVNIIIAALLINFSMFFTQVIIDAANIIALTFYHAIAPTAVTGNLLDAGLSNSLMRPLELNTIFNTNTTLTSGSIAIIGIMGSIITLIAAFIFFAIALMLVIRYVVLILVLILSPIAFIGDVIPGASGYAGQWRKALFGQAFFAPVYMFLTWITIKLFIEMFPVDQGSSWAKAFGGEITTNTGNVVFSESSVTLVFNFVVVIVFLIATLVLSKKVSESAGMGINNLTKKAMGFASGTLVGGTLRNTIGRIGGSVSDNASLQNAAKNKTGLGGAASRLALYASKKARSGTFDIQNAAVPTGMFSDAIRGTVGRTETGKKLGLDKFDAIPSINISDLTGEARGGDKGYREMQIDKNKKFEAIDKAANDELRLAQAKKDVEAGTKLTASPTEVAAMERALSKMTDKEVETMIANNKELLKSQNFANGISVQQLEAINKGDKLNEGEKQMIKDSRFGSISNEMDRLSAPVPPGGVPPVIDPGIQTAIGKLSDKEIEMLNPTHVMRPEFVAAMKDSQIEAIGKSNKFTKNQKDAIKTARTKPLDDDFATGNWTGAMDKMRKINAENLVKTDIARLTEPGILNIYRPALLNKMAARPELTDNKAAAIRTAILNAAALPGATPEILEAKIWLLGDGLKIF